jgi:ABC-type iron transport system FetAB permease component
MENTTLNRLDPIIGRILLVQPEITAEQTDPEKKPEKLMGYSLAFSAIRCILQYMILPFLLPVIGLAASWALGLTMVIKILAMVAIVTSLRRMWGTNYSHRWRYMALAAPAFILLLSFFILDLYTVARGGA